MSNIIIKVPSVFTVYLPPDDNYPPGYINLGNVTTVDFNAETKEAEVVFTNGDVSNFYGLRAIALWEAMEETAAVKPQVEDSNFDNSDNDSYPDDIEF